jgi:murein L,D-transpeptidase YafK
MENSYVERKQANDSGQVYRQPCSESDLDDMFVNVIERLFEFRAELAEGGVIRFMPFSEPQQVQIVGGRYTPFCNQQAAQSSEREPDGLNRDPRFDMIKSR